MLDAPSGSALTIVPLVPRGPGRSRRRGPLSDARGAEAFPDIPDIFFRPDFRLETPRDFDIVFGTSGRFDSLTLQERLTHYLDEV